MCMRLQSKKKTKKTFDFRATQACVCVLVAHTGATQKAFLLQLSLSPMLPRSGGGRLGAEFH